jgi:uncharacterized protein (UPF0335 family)
MNGPGHNSVSAEELLQLIERWERMDVEKRDIADCQNEVMAEAKGRGYDTKVIRKLIAERKRDVGDIAEEEAVLELYREAIKMPTGPRDQTPTNGDR